MDKDLVSDTSDWSLLFRVFYPLKK